jgi:hypothetical protein
METLQNSYTLNKNREEINTDIEMFYELLEKGLKCISSAKVLHDQMETYYIPNMNFDKINEVTEKVINKILRYEKDYLSEQ